MRRSAVLSVLLGVILCGLSVSAQELRRLPKVVLIGDSIRLGYAPTVVKKLEGKAMVVHSPMNGGDSARVLANLKDWAISEQPDVVHFNCGIHDTKKDRKTGKFQVPPEQYRANLRKIVETLRRETKATVIFATTTPIIDDRAAGKRKSAGYDLLDASTLEYNRIATQVMKELNVPVNDLRAACGERETLGTLMSDDGVHFTSEGRTQLGIAVADFVAKHVPSKP